MPDATETEPAGWPRPRPGPTVAWLVGVCLPIPLAMLLAQWLEMDTLALTGMVASVALAWWLLRSHGASWADVGLRADVSWWRLVLTVVPAVVVLFVVNVVLSAILGALGMEAADLGRFDFLRGNLGALFLMLGLAWLIGAFGEEMLRGVLLTALVDMLRPHAGNLLAWAFALVLTSAAFGAGHAHYGPAGVIITAVLAAGFGLVYLMTRRNLWAPILTHGLFDTAAFVILYITLNQPMATSMIFGSPGAAPGLFLAPGASMIA